MLKASHLYGTVCLFFDAESIILINSNGIECFDVAWIQLLSSLKYEETKVGLIMKFKFNALGL